MTEIAQPVEVTPDLPSSFRLPLPTFTSSPFFPTLDPKTPWLLRGITQSARDVASSASRPSPHSHRNPITDPCGVTDFGGGGARSCGCTFCGGEGV